METTTLRIKKKYFEAIKNRQKRYEYRKKSPFYDRIFSKLQPPFKIVFHYQSFDRISCIVDHISIVKTPPKIDKNIIPTENCYQISLRPIEEELVYNIIGIFKGEEELIESDLKKEEALYLINEYKIAFGNEWAFKLSSILKEKNY